MKEKYLHCIKFIKLLSIFIFLFALSSCSNKVIVKQSYLLLIKSKKIKFNDAVFINADEDNLEIVVLSLGKSIANIKIHKESSVCLDYICYDAKSFNAQYLTSKYDDELLNNIFRAKPIFNKKNIEINKNGFRQEIGDITYKKMGKHILFKDKKENIIIRLTKI